MNIVNIQQGSDQWIALRLKHFCASDAPAMLGLSRHTKRGDLLRLKSLGLSKEFSDFVMNNVLNKGNDAESAARAHVEAKLGTELYPATATCEVDGLSLLASFDGVSMDETQVWENKLLNGQNAIPRDVIDSEHWPQIEQQALVANIDHVYFTVSDGTENGTVGYLYKSDPKRRAQLLAGWKQFAEDLKNYAPVAEAEPVNGQAPEQLPALHIEVTGMVTNSNLALFKTRALSVINAINVDLQTDVDFASAEKTVKWCGEIEDRLDAAKQHALSQTASIDELFRAIDEIKSLARTKRLELDRLVKSRKESIRGEIVRTAQAALQTHVTALNARLGKPYMPAQDMTRFGLCIKGLKTVSSLRDAVNTELANAKIAASEDADKIEANLKTLRELASEYAFLFHDAAQLVLKANDDLTALVKTRIADHKAEEERRIESERARIRQEEEARANKIAQERAPISTPVTTTAPIPAVATSAPIPAPQAAVAAPTMESKVDAYLATIKELPKKKAEIRKHILAFLEFCAVR